MGIASQQDLTLLLPHRPARREILFRIIAGVVQTLHALAVFLAGHTRHSCRRRTHRAIGVHGTGRPVRSRRGGRRGWVRCATMMGPMGPGRSGRSGDGEDSKTNKDAFVHAKLL
jgi:hypothetical protein